MCPKRRWRHVPKSNPAAGYSPRHALLVLLILTGIGAVLSLVPAGAVSPAVSVPILMYHRVDITSPNCCWVPADDFDAQLAFLKQNGYTTITLDQFFAYRSRGTPLPAKPIILSFDDGYQLVYTVARPILAKYGYTATLFVFTDVLGTGEADREPGFLIWPEVLALAASGYDIQSHTCSHPDLTQLTGAALMHELVDSKATLEAKLGWPVNFLAYPYGSWNSTVAAATQSAGYLGALLDRGGVETTATSQPYALKRVFVQGGASLAQFAASIGASAPSQPAPVLTSVSLSRDTINLGETVDISVTAWNGGGLGENSGVTLSCPSLTGTGDAANASLLVSDWDSYTERARGTMAYDDTGRQITLSSLMVEGTSSSWGAGESRTLSVRLQPKTVGSFPITVRVWTTQGGVAYVYPTSSTTVDQQGWPAVTYSVVVQSGTATPPVADFTASPTSGVIPLVVQFTDASTGYPTSWSWSFGDGGTSTAQNPSHTYRVAGSYTISLTAANASGADTATGAVTAMTYVAPPKAAFTAAPRKGKAPLKVTFTDTSTGAPTSWAWTFGDGGTSTVQSPTHIYAAAGTYNVSLTVANAGGSSTLTKNKFISVRR